VNGCDAHDRVEAIRRRSGCPDSQPGGRGWPSISRFPSSGPRDGDHLRYRRSRDEPRLVESVEEPLNRAAMATTTASSLVGVRQYQEIASLSRRSLSDRSRAVVGHSQPSRHR
jgi:hypothetical protein